MKKNILLIIFLCFNLSVLAQRIDHSVSLDKVVGRVRSIKEYNYRIEEKFGELKKGEVNYIMVFNFNDKGQEIEQFFYSKDGNLSSKSIFKYDYMGKRTEENEYDKAGNFSYRTIFKYDELGNLRERNKYHSNGRLFLRYMYTSDERGRLTSEIEFDDYDRFKSKTFFKEYKDGDLTRMESAFSENDDISSNSEFDTIYKYGYDSRGNWINRDLRSSLLNYTTDRVITYF